VPAVDRPREAALTILSRVDEGAHADPLIDEARRSFGPTDSAFLLELVYGTLRNRLRLDWILDQFSAQPVETTDASTRNILRLAAYQMLLLDRVPVSAAVNTAVELAKKYGKKHGYVNGLLRSLDRKRKEIKVPGGYDQVSALAVVYSHPAWLVRRWVDRFGPEATEAVLASNNRPAPLIIRANAARTTRDGLRASLESEGAVVKATGCSPAGLEIVSTPGLTTLRAYRDGWFVVQDEAAQLVTLMLAPAEGENVLDACAAPGGKATHLAELMGDRGAVVALEIDGQRIGRLRENIGRLGHAAISVVRGDAATYRGRPFDKVLIDAPCSGLGVLRRHPDGRWNKTEQSVHGRVAIQAAILRNCASLLVVGGAVVYATCTTEPEENEHVISSFLAERGDTFVLDDPRPYLPMPARRLVDGQLFFRTFPGEPRMDGFFAARMVKTA
jgi:16S rRNA (cytosine967-C5)-methyltransferase